MLISRVLEDCGGRGEGEVNQNNHSHEYQTANELFDIMAKTQNFQPTDNEALSTRDLVILYKNIDLGTKLMSSANEFKKRSPNQYVETVVYNDDHDSDSDLSEIYSSEDLHNVVMINKERIDLLTNPSTLENTLCQKFGNIEINTSNFSTDCDRRFLFKDPYIKEQLKTLNLVSGSKEFDGTVLPASLLDYICCKRLEDNYNFYMENIIRYVQQTIEQLRRISNGDYLTEKAKAKWREVDNYDDTKDDNAGKKVLAMSTSIPLHVERKVTGLTTTWDDIVHSEVDVRHLSKVLEKKIVYEVPKMILGSYRLFSKCCADNVVISCKRDDASKPAIEKKKESRVDVVFKLARSESGHVMSNINSILIFQKTSFAQENYTINNNALPLPYIESEADHRDPHNTEDNLDSTSIVIKDYVQGYSDYPCSECSSRNDNLFYKNNSSKTDDYLESSDLSRNAICKSSKSSKSADCIEAFDITTYPGNLKESKNEVCNNSSGTSKNEGHHKIESENEEQSESKIENFESDLSRKAIYQESSDDYVNPFYPDSADTSSYKDVFDMKRKRTETPFNIVPPDELHITMQRLNMPGPVPEEGADMDDLSGSLRRKSPTRIRIKSPYENKSYLLEEKKRKRLLEIRERREKKKMAMSENCKVTKNKFGKPTITPQPSSSVTKLSITNKSFYNSIYGQANSLNVDGKLKGKHKNPNSGKFTMSEQNDDDDDTSEAASAHKQKYINRSYYLDDAVTEMMYMQMNRKEGGTEYSESTSIASNEFSSNMKLLTQLMEPVSTVNFESKLSSSTNEKLVEKLQETKNNKNIGDIGIVPANSPNLTERSKKTTTTVEFRKSIDKIYDLMHTLGKADDCESQPVKSKFTVAGTVVTSDKLNAYEVRDNSTEQCSDSGTSIKHRIESSNTSYISFDKANNGDTSTTRLKISGKSTELTAPVVPKVIISAKPQTCKSDGEKKTIKKGFSLKMNSQDNPLKAISQLLHEFDSVQKTRIKSTGEPKSTKKPDCSPDKKASRQVSNKKQLRFDTNNDNESPTERFPRPKDRRPKQHHTAMDRHKSQQQQPILKRQVIDIVEEYKEARGEAVRGPSKHTSRIQSLAQPKKTYVQAHMEEYQTKYGRNMMSDRLQKLAAPSPPTFDKRGGSARQRIRKAGGTEALLMSTVKQTISTSERVSKARQSTSCNPEVMAMPPSEHETSSYKQNNVIEKPDILKKKMVAVESYVKNHYGRDTLSADANQSLLRPRDARREMAATASSPLPKSRVPLIPNDLEQVSLSSTPITEESTIIGRKLHHIIDTMINSPVPTLTAVAESNEEVNKQTGDNNTIYKRSHSANKMTERNKICNANEMKCDELKTKASHIALNSKNKRVEETCVEKYEIRSLKSNVELQELENALSSRLSVGTFHKRLRIKNLTLTPKHSTQQVLLYQSGDVGSLVVKSTTSQNVVMNQTKSATIADLKTLSRMPDKNLTFGKFPVQIATVGYMFPVHKKNVNNIFKSEYFLDNYDGSSNCQKLNFKIEDIGRHDHHKIENKMSKNTNDVNASGYNRSEEALEQPDKLKISQNNTRPQEIKNVKIETVDSTHESVCAISDNIDYSTSLDLLVGLLNEIQNITTCQTQIAATVENIGNDEEGQHVACLPRDTVEEDQPCPCKPKDIISFTSLDRLRQLDSSPSIYSLYLSHEDDVFHEHTQAINTKFEVVNDPKENTTVTCADKEINVDIPEKEVINQCTEVPSQLIALTKNGSTNVSDSLCGILSHPSAPSIITVEESQTEINVDSNSTSELKTIIKLQNISTTGKKNSEIKSDSLVPRIDNKLEIIDTKIFIINGINEEMQNCASISKKMISEKLLVTADYDPTMKIKRDVLVTVYSILMLTVFAALSFPELMYRS